VQVGARLPERKFSYAARSSRTVPTRILWARAKLRLTILERLAHLRNVVVSLTLEVLPGALPLVVSHLDLNPVLLYRGLFLDR